MGIGTKKVKEKKAKAIFLDRDGTIIRQVELLIDSKKVRILSGVPEAIRAFGKLGFLVVTISNQPVIARGIITEAGVRAMDAMIRERLKKKGAVIHASYFCPHHPNATLKKYRTVCDCRKPAPGMLVKAMRDFNIDPKKSFMIGDAMIDVVAGQAAGLKSIRVGTGPGHSRLDAEYADTVPDYIAKDLGGVARWIKKQVI